MNRATLRIAASALVGLCIWVVPVRGDKAQVEERLKQTVSIRLEDTTIAQALEMIGRQAGVKIELSPEAIWKLPEGQDTRLSVGLQGRLAESLEKMLANFFLRYAVGSESLTIHPRPELKHIIGRPTQEELTLLTSIYTNKMWISITKPDLPEDFVQAAINNLAKEPVTVLPVIELGRIGKVMHTLAMSSSSGIRDANSPARTPVTLALLLEGVLQLESPRKTWYIEGPAFPREVAEIRIVSREDFGRARLDQIVDVSFENESGETIIRNLAMWADMDLEISDFVAQELRRTITFQVQNVKLLDALGKALSALGIAWSSKIDTDVISLSGLRRSAGQVVRSADSEPTARAVSTGDYVGKISIPMDGGRYFIEFMLRESDLPPELRKLRQETMTRILAELSQQARSQEALSQGSNSPAQQ